MIHHIQLKNIVLTFCSQKRNNAAAKLQPATPTPVISSRINSLESRLSALVDAFAVKSDVMSEGVAAESTMEDQPDYIKLAIKKRKSVEVVDEYISDEKHKSNKK